MTDGKAPQLCMLILSQGGTGKSLLIAAIMETFEYYNQTHILAKCATTGIAATDIGGVTLHSWAGLSKRAPTKPDWLENATKKTTSKCVRNIEGKAFLVMDKISMCDKTAVYLTSEVTRFSRRMEYKGSSDEPFGGMHVILTGDFHQFLLVSNASGALYVERDTDTVRAILGREIFKQFDTVVILNKQIRVKDKVWIDILNRLRVGECNYDNIDEIEKLVLDHKDCIRPDFQQTPWKDAILVTPRHTVRKMWNEECISRHSREMGNIRYVFQAKDTVKSTRERPSIAARCKIVKLDNN